jgi:hypothetical protein
VRGQIRDLLETYYPDTPKIRLVMDNLNTHSISSLYEAFSPEIAHRPAKRLEIHHTPKHGSWLNIAEIELSAYSTFNSGFGTLKVGNSPKFKSKRCRLAVYDQHGKDKTKKTLSSD